MLDLEGIANHKGSSFGLTPGEVQPTTEHAENMIFARLAGFDESRPVWVENESRNIGKVYLPEGLTSGRGAADVAMSCGSRRRSGSGTSCLSTGATSGRSSPIRFTHLRKRLGGAATQVAIDAVDAGDLAAAAEIALVYYDKTYAHYSERQGWADTELIDTSMINFPALARRLAGEEA